MINPQELRLGNWVNLYDWDSESKPHQITEIINGDQFIDCTPIPLSPEILEKAGFVKDAFHNYTRKLKPNLITTEAYLVFAGDYLYLRHYNGENRMDDSVVTLWNKDLMEQFYLHKLQNLVYDLEGEELEITL